MKKLFLLLLPAAFVSKTQAQKCNAKDVPLPAMNAFSKSYPNAKKTCWGKDSINYVVEFSVNKKPAAVTYDITGKRVITEMQMPVEELPQSIMEYVQKNYPGEIFKEAAQITNAEGVVTYEVQVKNLDLVFDAKGNFLQSIKCYE